jgi:hypothetical protein
MLAGVVLDGLLGDVVYLVITVAFFALAWSLVRLCERIAGAADVAEVAGVVEISGAGEPTDVRAAS